MIASILSFIWIYIIPITVVLSILVFVHELGHFWVARKFGLKPKEFGFGFPPRAIGVYKTADGSWKKVKGTKDPEDAVDTIYSINWFPMGGFVQLGEDDDPGNDPNHFNNKKIWQRSCIIVAGVTMNIILAAFLFSVGYMIGLPQEVDPSDTRAIVSDRKVQVTDVMENSPAELAEVKAGDVILRIENQEFLSTEEIQKFVGENAGNELVYKIKRGDKVYEKKIVPEIRPETNIGGIGIGIIETAKVRYSFFTAIFEGFRTTYNMTILIVVAFGKLLAGLFMGKGLGGDVAGPVGIASLTGQVAQLGMIYILRFTAVLSINLAILNALPIPALDGGRLLFLFIEKIKGSPVKKEVEAIIHNTGFALLMLLVLVVTIKDISRFSDKFIMLWDKIIG